MTPEQELIVSAIRSGGDPETNADMLAGHFDDAVENEAAAYDQGLHDARLDVQPVYAPGGEGPLFFISWIEDVGDPSVGIDGWAQWEVVSFEDLSRSTLSRYTR